IVVGLGWGVCVTLPLSAVLSPSVATPASPVPIALRHSHRLSRRPAPPPTRRLLPTRPPTPRPPRRLTRQFPKAARVRPLRKLRRDSASLTCAAIPPARVRRSDATCPDSGAHARVRQRPRPPSAGGAFWQWQCSSRALAR